MQTFNLHVVGLSTKIPNLQKLAHESLFTWNTDLQGELNRAKEAIEKHLILFPFDPSLPLQMFVDACIQGFGLVLVHPAEGESKQFLFAASAVAKEVHTRYTSYELELCGLMWTLRKISYYGLGNRHVEVLTDHRALESAMQRRLTPELSNRVFRLLEEALSCNISIKHISGEGNMLADYLSRSPTDVFDTDVAGEGLLKEPEDPVGEVWREPPLHGTLQQGLQ